MTSRRTFLTSAALFGASAAVVPQKTVAHAATARGEPRLKLGIATDIHLNTNYELGMNYEAFERLLNLFKARGVDGVVLCGDVINGWEVTEFRQMMEIWTKVFGSPKEHGPGHVEMLYVTGNHEVYCFPEKIPEHPNWFCHPDNCNKVWREYFGEDYPKGFHRRVKGFSFVGAHYGNFHDSVMRPYFEEAFAATKPGDPIFYLAHHPQPRTCYGSDVKRDGGDALSEGAGTVYKLFKGHPNVITFSGDTHKAGAHPQSIWQGDYTAIHAGVVTWCEFRDHAWPHDFFPQVQYAKDVQFLTVYENEIVIERRNIVHDFATGPDWHLPLPLTPATFNYTPEKMRARAGNPKFPAGARPVASLAMAEQTSYMPWPCNAAANRTWTKEGKSVLLPGGTIVSFPAAQAVGPEDLIRAYDVTAYDAAGRKLLTKRVDTEFFYGPRGMKSFYTCYFSHAELPRGKKYTFTVQAVTCLGFTAEIKD